MHLNSKGLYLFNKYALYPPGVSSSSSSLPSSSPSTHHNKNNKAITPYQIFYQKLYTNNAIWSSQQSHNKKYFITSISHMKKPGHGEVKLLDVTCQVGDKPAFNIRQPRSFIPEPGVLTTG